MRPRGTQEKTDPSTESLSGCRHCEQPNSNCSPSPLSERSHDKGPMKLFLYPDKRARPNRGAGVWFWEDVHGGCLSSCLEIFADKSFFSFTDGH